MTDNEVIRSYCIEEHARLDYAAHLWRRCGYEKEAAEAQARADKYRLDYENALRRQAGLPETTQEELDAWRKAYHEKH